MQSIAHKLLPQLAMYVDAKKYILGKDGHVFIGYYDIDPVDTTNKKVLCHRVSLQFTNSIEPHIGDIGLISIESPNVFDKIGETKAVNWQLGSRLQWISEQEIIYNDIIDDKQCSILFNLEKNIVQRQFIRPFWALSPNLSIGVSLNFARLSVKRPGYGYGGVSPDGDNDTLTIFEISTDQVLFQITLDEVVGKIGFNLPEGADAYFNHVTWSPCSTRFITLFLFEEPSSGERFSYPVLVNCLDYSVSLFHNEGLFSHHVWLDDERVLAFLKLDGVNTFAVWDSSFGWNKSKENMPSLDGHPSILSDSDELIVDSYPDRLGRMSLYRASTDVSKKLLKISRIMNSKVYSGAHRCDLHPRVSKGNKYIICDAPFQNGRRVLVIENSGASSKL
ncbi:MAG: hypothetical protein ACRBBR_11715 [Cellvibrionaceae bacterium]